MQPRHEISEVKVYKADNFTIFNRISGNRAINHQKVRKMVHEINHGNNLLQYFPILVSPGRSGKLDVIDGQHRLQAAKGTKKTIYYILKEEDTELGQIAKMNSLQEKWKKGDFLECYIEKGIEDYKRLASFLDEYPVPLSVALNLLTSGITGGDRGLKSHGDVMHEFQHGQFKVKHMKQARELLDYCKQFEAFDGWSSRGFIVAISKILAADLIDQDELVEKFKKNPAALEKQGNYKGYLTNLEMIYNRGYSQRRTIY